MVLAGCGNVASALSKPGLPSVSRAAAGPVVMNQQIVELVGDGQSAVDRIVSAISAAGELIEVEIYEFDREDIADALVAARSRGVTVVVIGDPTVEVNHATFARLRAAGATVLLFPDGTMQIDHVKLLIADHRTGIFGGMNWGRGSYRNHDFDLVVMGSVVAHLDSIFARDLVRCGWAGKAPGGSTPDPPALQFFTTYPEEQVRPAVLDAIATARNSVFVEMYVLTDGQVMSALGSAARRGVEVWVLFDPNQELNQAAAARLRQSGVTVRFYRSSGEKLHAKAMVVDGRRLTVGSANWTSSGFTRNHELDAVVENSPLAEAALARMEADWRASG
jgi:cardiolipin synthase